jgi:hypothetical protein
MMKHTALIMIMVIMQCGYLHATVIEIPSDQPTIQAGIDDAVDGDTVLVSRGTYPENVNFKGKGVLLTSNFIFTRDSLDIYSTVIEGGSHTYPDTGSCVYFISGENYTSQLAGFTLQNGRGIEFNGEFYVGGDILCSGSSPFIRSNLIHESDPHMSDGNGGGIAAVNFSNPIIMDNIISDNFAGVGGGLFAIHSEAFIYRNHFHLNDAWAYGGGIFTFRSSLILEQNLFTGNVASDWAMRGWGGALYLYNCPGTTIRNNTFTDNFGLVLGGAIFSSNSPSSLILIENTILFENSYFGLAVGGPPQTIILLYNDFWGNYPGNYDGISPGEFDISEDPLFIDEVHGDYRLLSNSPCIDSGNPDSHNVPWGGYRRDMGAFEYDQGFYFDGHHLIFKPFRALIEHITTSQ